MTTRAPPSSTTIAALRERLQRLDGGLVRRRAVLPFGIAAIDDRLPDGGLALGALHEVSGGGNGAADGAAAALFAAGIAARTRGRVLWCVTRQDLFAPALAAAGLAPDRVIHVEAGDEKTLLACFEEGLRHRSGLGAVVAEVAQLSMTASRRLQLAAEGSGAIGIAIRHPPAFGRIPDRIPLERRRLAAKGVTARSGEGDDARPAAARRRRSEADHFGSPTAAVTRWRISPLPSAPLPTAGIGRARWRLELVRCRGGESAGFNVEACDAQGRLGLHADVSNRPSGQRTTSEGRWDNFAALPSENEIALKQRAG